MKSIFITLVFLILLFSCGTYSYEYIGKDYCIPKVVDKHYDPPRTTTSVSKIGKTTVVNTHHHPEEFHLFLFYEKYCYFNQTWLKSYTKDFEVSEYEYRNSQIGEVKNQYTYYYIHYNRYEIITKDKEEKLEYRDSFWENVSYDKYNKAGNKDIKDLEKQ